MRSGPQGLFGINQYLAQNSRRKMHIKGDEPWYASQPVLITQNDYQLNLFNGDLGIVSVNSDNLLSTHFQEIDKTYRMFLPFRLPEYELSYAMTVHKSQGSEFERVIIILPEEDSKILTRELLYTAITRASLKTVATVLISKLVQLIQVIITEIVGVNLKPLMGLRLLKLNHAAKGKTGFRFVK